MRRGAQLLVGRSFTEGELEDIKYIVRQFSHLSRNELAKTICEGLEWVAPNGKYKTLSFMQLLEKEGKKLATAWSHASLTSEPIPLSGFQRFTGNS